MKVVESVGNNVVKNKKKQKDKVHTSTPEGRHFVQAHTKEREKQQN